MLVKWLIFLKDNPMITILRYQFLSFLAVVAGLCSVPSASAQPNDRVAHWVGATAESGDWCNYPFEWNSHQNPLSRKLNFSKQLTWEPIFRSISPLYRISQVLRSNISFSRCKTTGGTSGHFGMEGTRLKARSFCLRLTNSKARPCSISLWRKSLSR